MGSASKHMRLLLGVPMSAVLGMLGSAVLTPADAQLRPLDPMDWEAFDEELGSAFIGVAGFRGQPASLLGSEGRLIELGWMGAAVRSGRIVLSFQGTAYRLFDPSESFAEPLPNVEGQNVARRKDTGDFRLATAMRLTSGAGSWNAAFRFGVRLPTTNDRVGLERDMTDFFTTLGVRYQRGPLAWDVDLGGAINGVAGSLSEQTDPVLYSTGVAYQWSGWEPALRLSGQYDTRFIGPPRGNEHLSELKLGARTLGTTWLHANVVYGLADFSPDLGLELRLGRSF